MSSPPKVEVVAHRSCHHTGEGPLWEPRTGSLLYVDIQGADVHRWDSHTGQDTKHHLGWGIFKQEYMCIYSVSCEYCHAETASYSYTYCSYYMIH